MNQLPDGIYQLPSGNQVVVTKVRGEIFSGVYVLKDGVRPTSTTLGERWMLHLSELFLQRFARPIK